MNKLVRDRTTVYNVGYHMVWSIKYRRKIIYGTIERQLKNILLRIAQEKDFHIKEIELMPDYVHVFVSAKPKFSPSYIYKMLKGINGRRLFLQCPEIKEK